MADIDDNAFLAHPPAHPVSQLQGPFEESMVESVNDVTDRESRMDCVARRTMLLEKPKYERVIAGRWKQKPGEKFHPLWKITAQVSFGMHLLAEGMAKSDDEVMKILQCHVDDIDDFLERTTEDFDLAQSDIEERLRYLKLPLAHVEIFERMLEDRAFRTSIVDGNEKIEHIVERTSEAMKDAMKDVQKGLDATKTLRTYLVDLGRTWQRGQAEHEAVYLAMIGNVEGWSHAFMDLHLQGNKLGKSLVRLSEIVAEMQKRAGIVSRRTIGRPPSGAPTTRHSQKPSNVRGSLSSNEFRRTSRPSSRSHPDSPKPLPSAPGLRQSAQSSFPNTFPRQSPSLEKHAIAPGPHIAGSNGSTSGTNSPAKRSFVTARTTPTSPHPQNSFVSELAATEVVRSPPLAPQPLQPRAKNSQPMELPAELPQEVMVQAPHSNTSRFSTILGLKSKDMSELRSSKLFSTNILSQRKSSASPSIEVSRFPSLRVPSQSSQNPAEARRSGSSSQMIASGSGTPIIGSSRVPSSPDRLADGLGIHGLARVSQPSSSSRRSSPHQNLALASNPPDTSILPGRPSTAAKTSGLDGLPTPPGSSAASQTHPLSHKSQKSSLGEPGPEVGIDEAVPVQIAGKGLLDAIAARSMLSSSTGRSQISGQSRTKPDLDVNRVTEDTSEAAGIPFYAEMEGSSPMVLAPATFEPVELEAAPQRLVLPPRPENKQDEHTLTATILSHGDFFKLPQIPSSQKVQELAHMPSVSSPTPGHQSMPVQGTGQGDGSVRAGRSSFPAHLNGNTILREDGPNASQSRRHPGLLDSISYTPPDSPIHARSVSDASWNSARLLTERASSALAPQRTCPAPPAPGGRNMVEPDFARAAAFDGERKSKHSSAGSGSGSRSSIKRFFSPVTTPPSSTDPRTGSDYVGVAPEQTARSSGTDMLTAAGKDVLWFRGMGKNGVWVT